MATITDSDLLELEEHVQRCIATRSFDGLKVLGFGEIGVAIGWPTSDPMLVVKRLAAARDEASVAAWFNRITRYEEALQPHLAVAPTEQRTVKNADGWNVPYMIQPLYAKESLCENVLANEEPRVDHPMVIAIRDAVLSVSADGRFALDSQFSNFAWDGAAVTLFDTGSPFLYDADGSPDIDLGTYSRALPSIVHPIVRKLVADLSRNLQSAHRNLAHAALSVLRLGQDRWIEAILTTFNAELPEGQQVGRSDVDAQFAQIHKQMTTIKNLARTQRIWATKIRREPYDFFLTDSFTGELL